VGRHIIGAFERVLEKRQVFRYQAIEYGLKVHPDGRVGILIDGQAGGGVEDEEMEQAVPGQLAGDGIQNVRGDEMETTWESGQPDVYVANQKYLVIVGQVILPK